MIGILATSHPGHRIFLNESLSYLSRYNGPVILGWDDKEFIWHRKLPENIELMLTGKTLGLQHGEMWQIENGAKKLKSLGCKYLLKTAGDQLIKKYDKIDILISNLKRRKVLTKSKPHKYAIGTQLFFIEIDVLFEIIEMKEKLFKYLNLIEPHKVKGIERIYGMSGLMLGIITIPQEYAWWQNMIGYKDMQQMWILKTGKKYNRAWEEGAKNYDMTESDLNKIPDETGKFSKFCQRTGCE